jgi:hypothetical protein
VVKADVMLASSWTSRVWKVAEVLLALAYS